ncbi:MAG: L-dopachrome tautomerase-related protein [Rhodospirillales bacterium]
MPYARISIKAVVLGLALLLLSAVATDRLAAQEPAPFEVVALLEQAPGNVAVTADGRIIVSQHQFYDPVYRVVEVLGDGSTQPFPNQAWASAPGPDGRGMVAVLGLRADPAGTIWMLDNGSKPPRLIGWDLNGDQLAKIIPIPPPAAVEISFLNDFALDTVNGFAYIADFGEGPRGGAIVVVDLMSGEARRVLAGHPYTSAEDVRMVIDGRPVRMRGADGQVVEPRVAINPISIDALAEWVYFGAMHGTSLYRVRAADLRDASLSEDALAKRVERFGAKPISDGISMDGAGNVYVTDVQASGIGVTRPDGQYQLLFSDKERLKWPDGIAAGPDNNMYVTVNKLNLSAKLNAGVNESEPLYFLVRFPALAPTVVGR